MSSVVVVTPLIVASWPVVTAAVTAAMGTLGFNVLAAKMPAAAKAVTRNRAEIDAEESEILNESVAGSASEIVVEGQGVKAVFSRDARGGLKLCVEGDNKSKAELKQIGEELMGSVTQQYAYHKIVSELQQRNMTIVAEEVGADRTVKLRVRNG